MKRWLFAVISVVGPGIATCLAEVQLDLGTARISLDNQGQVSVAAGAVRWPATARPAFFLETDQGRQFPQSVTLAGENLKVQFHGAYVAEFAVKTHPGFAVLDLKRLEPQSGVRALGLFSLAGPVGSHRRGVINAITHEGLTAALMAAEPNVEPYAESVGGHRGDRTGCSHSFAQDKDAKVGRCCARFTASSDEKAGGWSVTGRELSQTLDLTGCKAIRAWVHGDGKTQALKIQLADNRGGYRDDYLPIDFTGWRQVILSKPAYNTLRYNEVRALSFYYNSMPPGQTVTCLIDQVEAVLDRGGKEEVVLLEDFESPNSPLWAGPMEAIHLRTASRHGLTPARFGVLVAPDAQFFDTVRRFEPAAGIRAPMLGGAWNKTSPWIKRNYFFLTSFRESQFDEAISIARRGGFHAILIGQESWCRATGHYEINRDHFPDGLEGLKRTIRRFKDAGFLVGLHFLGPSIYPPDPYLTPVPDPRLVKKAAAVLAADLDAKAVLVPIDAPPAEFPAEDGGYEGDGTVIQIDDELIHYGTRVMDRPFGFVQCRRGILGTKPAEHKKGARVAHLLRSYGYHLFDMDTTLLDEVSSHFAKVADACDIDMIYFDGSERLQGDHWYYNARLHKAFHDKLKKKDILMQASSFSHYSWHLLARSASADGHGDLKGYLDERSPGFTWMAREGMPLDIGWYYGYDTDASLDMYEYILGATIGYNSSMSFQVSPAAAACHPFTGPILDLIARYERLRLSGRVPEEMKARLRIDPALGGNKQPQERASLVHLRRDYRLLGPEGNEVFQRVFYEPWHYVASAAPEAAQWNVEIKGEPARVGVAIHAQAGHWLGAGPSYQAPDAVTLESFDDLSPFAGKPQAQAVRKIENGQAGSTLPGVTQRLELADGGPGGGAYALYSAESTLALPAGWSTMGRQFNPPLDISWHKGIGFWMRGDGKGGALKLQLLDGKGAMDYYVQNTFSGWRYQQLARPEKDPIDYHRVTSLLIYYNGLPAKTAVACGIDGVKALRKLDEPSLMDPFVEVAGRRFAWKGSLSAGQYLIFWPGEPIGVYGPPLREPDTSAGPAAEIALPPGRYPVRFGCAGAPTMPVRARLTLQPPERHPVPSAAR